MAWMSRLCARSAASTEIKPSSTASTMCLQTLRLLFVTEGVQFFERVIFHRFAIGGSRFFNVAEAAVELGIGFAQSRLRLNVQPPRPVDDYEQQIAHFFGAVFVVCRV